MLPHRWTPTFARLLCPVLMMSQEEVSEVRAGEATCQSLTSLSSGFAWMCVLACQKNQHGQNHAHEYEFLQTLQWPPCVFRVTEKACIATHSLNRSLQWHSVCTGDRWRHLLGKKWRTMCNFSNIEVSSPYGGCRKMMWIFMPKHAWPSYTYSYWSGQTM